MFEQNDNKNQNYDYNGFYDNNQNENGESSYVNIYSDPGHAPKKNHSGKAVVKAVAAVAALAIVSVSSIEMYKLFGKGQNSAPNWSSSAEANTVITETQADTEAPTAEATEKAAATDGAAKVTNYGGSWVNMAAPTDALTIPQIVQKAMPSAVGISSTFEYTAQSTGMNGFWGFGFYDNYGGGQETTKQVTATGSGIVMSSDGYIITNAHVIYDTESQYKMGKAKSVSVVMGENHDQEYEAEIIGYDVQTDLAVLKIDAQDLTPAEFGNSDNLEVGELVVAIGNPLGFELYGTTTCGIVSALNREVQLEDRTMTLIQTDAAINSGNSGGPLLNAYGQVIGINSMKMGSSYGSASVEGLGFAIPITDAKTVIDSLINNGYVTGRPQFGITGVTVTESDAERFNLPQGVYVYGVSEGSAAEQAGLRQGDIITAVDGTEIKTMEELNEQKNKHKAGETVTLSVSRSGETVEIRLTLQEIKQEN